MVIWQLLRKAYCYESARFVGTNCLKIMVRMTYDNKLVEIQSYKIKLKLTSAKWFGNEWILLEGFVHQRRGVKFGWVLNIGWLSAIIGKGMIVVIGVVSLRNIAILITISTSTGSTWWSWCRSAQSIGWDRSICQLTELLLDGFTDVMTIACNKNKKSNLLINYDIRFFSSYIIICCLNAL